MYLTIIFLINLHIIFHSHSRIIIKIHSSVVFAALIIIIYSSQLLFQYHYSTILINHVFYLFFFFFIFSFQVGLSNFYCCQISLWISIPPVPVVLPFRQALDFIEILLFSLQLFQIIFQGNALLQFLCLNHPCILNLLAAVYLFFSIYF